MGLGTTGRTGRVFTTRLRGVDKIERRDGLMCTTEYITPVGTVSETSRRTDDLDRVGIQPLVVEKLLKRPEDYDVVKYMVEHTEYYPCYEEFRAYDRYDVTVCLSGQEARAIEARARHTRVLHVPMTQEPVAVSNTYDGPALFAATRGRTVALKSLLLDQAVVAGGGNIYADEALHFAGVRPSRSAGRATRSECDRIAAALRRVMERAIETGGSSISDFVAPDGSDGRYQDERRVYARTGEPCLACGTKIRRIVIGQRSSHYCPRCQK